MDSRYRQLDQQVLAYLETIMAQNVDILGQHGERTSDAENGERLDRKPAEAVSSQSSGTRVQCQRYHCASHHNETTQLNKLRLKEMYPTHKANTTPQSPVLRTTSIVPQF